MLNKKALAASSTVPQYIEDVFSTYLYTGTGSSQTITNNIDLSTKNGLVWIKSRSGTTGHRLTDTVRGTTKSLESNSTAAEATESTGLTAFGTTGFTIGADADYNTNTGVYSSWSFRKQAKFFDVVTYTGNGSNRTISHNLGSVPGCIIVKRTDTTGDWQVYHRSIGNTKYLVLNTTAAEATSSALWNDTTPTSTVFSLGTDATVNANNGTYVAYLFAHDAGGFGLTGTDNVISCGSYTGAYPSDVTVTLGWEPQLILVKNASQSSDWFIYDTMRGMSWDPDRDYSLATNSSAVENGVSGAAQSFNPTPTGFIVNSGLTAANVSGKTHIYIAIRRGPMKTPTDATKVFQPVVYTGTNADNRLVNMSLLTDMTFVRQRDSTAVSGMVVGDRLRGDPYLLTASTAAEVSDANSFMTPTSGYGNSFSSMVGFGVGNDATSNLNASTTSNNQIAVGFRRAPGFFDVVAFKPTSNTDYQVNHNLQVIPELAIMKGRDVTSTWGVYTATGGLNQYLDLSNPTGFTFSSGTWTATQPTATTINVNPIQFNTTTDNILILYLFASLTGVSKVGTYTGNGSNQTINCGFTAGARFVLIKRTDSTGQWYVYDSARGIVSGNDPQLKLNSTDAEATGFDAIDPDNSGFIVNNDATNFPINVNTATYIYLAIA